MACTALMIVRKGVAYGRSTCAYFRAPQLATSTSQPLYRRCVLRQPAATRYHCVSPLDLVALHRPTPKECHRLVWRMRHLCSPSCVWIPTPHAATRWLRSWSKCSAPFGCRYVCACVARLYKPDCIPPGIGSWNPSTYRWERRKRPHACMHWLTAQREWKLMMAMMCLLPCGGLPSIWKRSRRSRMSL